VLWLRSGRVSTTARGQITLVGGGSLAADTATLTNAQVGDLILFCARRANNTPAIMPFPWTQIEGGTGANTLSMITGWWIADEANPTSEQWTNATQIMWVILRGNAPLSVGASSTLSNASASNISFPALALQNPDGTSWGLRFVSRAGTTAMSEFPAGWNPVSGTTSNGYMAIFYLGNQPDSITQQTVVQSGSSASRVHTIEVRVGEGSTTVTAVGPELLMWDSEAH
jgi:hypothetical protein